MSEKHVIVEEHSGNGWTIWVTATCSCGWRGQKLWGFDSIDYHDYEREKRMHLEQHNLPSNLAKTVAYAKAEYDSWLPENRASVRLEGSSYSRGK